MKKREFMPLLAIIAVLSLATIGCSKNDNDSGDNQNIDAIEFTGGKDIYTEPYLVSLTPFQSMNVIWLTGENANEAWVDFGETEGYGQKINAMQFEIKGMRRSATPDGYDTDPINNPEVPVFQQIGELINLKPATKYFYRVTTKIGSKTIAGSPYHFKTAPSPNSNQPFKFILLSDLQLKAQILDTVRLAGQQNADFIIYAGDFQNTPWKIGEWFPVDGCFIAPAEKGKEWFTAMQQTQDSTRLLQYLPIFPCPGNHEIDDQRILVDKEMASDPSKKTMSIYLQLFRPLYPEQTADGRGKRWYSFEYGNMHMISLSAARWYDRFAINGHEEPGWFMFEDIYYGSPQITWLEDDLTKNQSRRYKWVFHHYDILNRGYQLEGFVPMSDPMPDPNNPGRVIYPYGDLGWHVLRSIYEKYDVTAVSFGHTHVYERYLLNKVHYIEAATIGNNYRGKDDPPHFSGVLPLVEQNDFRSVMVVSSTPERLSAIAIKASADGDESLKVGDVFDEFVIAPK